MRSAWSRFALVFVLVVAVFLVLFADLLVLSASADPLGAAFTPVSPSTVSRSYEASSFRVSSRLVDGSGAPIAGASVQVLQRVVGGARMEVVGSAVTRADGSFVAVVPRGPSRRVELAYFEGGVVVAQALVFERVSAGLHLRVTPRRTSPSGSVTLEGRVLGVVPSRGVVVEVLVYYLGVWQPIRTPRTSGDGRFRVSYRFHRAFGEFPFRVRVRDGQVGFPYGGGWSRWVGVLV